MKINISVVSNLPIYEQIKNQIREQVLSGKLESKSQLPSIRALARELKVGVITTKRAYEDLSMEGILVSKAGKGYFVADLDYEFVKKNHLKLIKEQIMDIKNYAQEAGILKDEVLDILNSVFGDE
ncbi:GntR family transcriptional regulator [Anaerosacchariphilus polymeriproducens]|uniref:GntR family transcriptional regulator n=1 Tax=Anaerosacchariphilus polymeriproducens TaxID=1812858 RepID=A0A371AVG4_9FIRM|nr:GntR family transcriptional regulator [Anaerosacchariphilus polymeriproducens]RDU23575.1 GntR family transcriptional regulator [Anaerosacchariphilus polymeriproducens]